MDSGEDGLKAWASRAWRKASCSAGVGSGGGEAGAVMVGGSWGGRLVLCAPGGGWLRSATIEVGLVVCVWGCVG